LAQACDFPFFSAQPFPVQLKDQLNF